MSNKVCKMLRYILLSIICALIIVILFSKFIYPQEYIGFRTAVRNSSVYVIQQNEIYYIYKFNPSGSACKDESGIYRMEKDGTLCLLYSDKDVDLRKWCVNSTDLYVVTDDKILRISLTNEQCIEEIPYHAADIYVNNQDVFFVDYYTGELCRFSTSNLSAAPHPIKSIDQETNVQSSSEYRIEILEDDYCYVNIRPNISGWNNMFSLFDLDGNLLLQNPYAWCLDGFICKQDNLIWMRGTKVLNACGICSLDCETGELTERTSLVYGGEVYIAPEVYNYQTHTIIQMASFYGLPEFFEGMRPRARYKGGMVLRYNVQENFGTHYYFNQSNIPVVSRDNQILVYNCDRHSYFWTTEPFYDGSDEYKAKHKLKATEDYTVQLVGDYLFVFDENYMLYDMVNVCFAKS